MFGREIKYTSPASQNVRHTVEEGSLFVVNGSLLNFFFQAEDGIRDHCVTGVQRCALPIYALRWLLQQLTDVGREYDAFVVLDADSIVSRDFLRCMDGRLEAGSDVIQAYYQVLNAGDSKLKIGRASCRERVEV